MKMAAFLFIAAALLLFRPVPVSAAITPLFAARELIRSDQRLEMAPGESKTFTIGFKNTGLATWRSEGKNFVSIYTFDPKYRKSVFTDSSWMGEVQPVRLSEAQVAPGQIGRVTFTLYAPLEPNTYRETFALAAESLAWIPGGKFTIEIVVKEQQQVIDVGANGAVRKAAAGFKAIQLLVSDKELKLEAGQTKDFRVAFKNIGRTIWQKSGDFPLVLRAEPASNAFSFRDSSWADNDTASQLSATEIKPGELSFFNFRLTAPRSGGVYLARFTLNAGDDLVEGGEIQIPIEVRQGLVPATVSDLYDEQLSNSGARGPNIRVGLYYTTESVTIAGDGAYTLIDGNDNAVAKLSGVTTVAFDFSARTYKVTSGSFSYNTDKHVRFTPDNPATTIFEIQSLENRPTWDTSINFNRYRGSLEVFYTRATDKLWVIEELPVEDYMRGLAETSNASPYEYQKSLVTAARTYALFVVSIGGKHKSEYFDVNTTGNDQVYKGYVSELVRPNVVRAAEDTRGTVVTYGGEIVVTPYFSRSDGRTRSWTEVWSSNNHPWLISKPAPYDQGLTLWGHGVGMSANDAFGRANAGAGWEEILKYYYTGIELKKLY
jgi:hypothetical protein